MQTCRDRQRPSKRISDCQCAGGDSKDEAEDQGSSGQWNYWVWFFNNSGFLPFLIYPQMYSSRTEHVHCRHGATMTCQRSFIDCSKYALWHRKLAVCTLLVFLILWQNIWQKQLRKGRIYAGSWSEDIVHHGREDTATANIGWVSLP